MIGLLVKNEDKNISKDKIWSFFKFFGLHFCDMFTNSIIKCFLWVSKVSKQVSSKKSMKGKI